MSSTTAQYRELVTDQAVWATFSLVQPYLAGRRVLDVGCGVGRYLERMAARSVGIDASAPSLANCHQRGLRVSLADLNQDLPFCSASFDGLLVSHVLEHVDSPLGLLRECRRVLQVGGHLVIGLPIETSLVRLFDRYYEDHPGHLYSFSTNGIRALLDAAGFSSPATLLEPPFAVRRGVPRLMLSAFQRIPRFMTWPVSTAYWAISQAI